MLRLHNNNKIERYQDAILRWLFVPACLLCGYSELKKGIAVCDSCWRELIPKEWKDRDVHRLTRDMQSSYIEGFSAILQFDDRVQKIIHEFKYRRRPGLAGEIIANTRQAILHIGAIFEVDMLVPVPLHRSRKRSRGYNQSRLLAEEMGSLLQRPVYVDLVRRRRRTRSQTKLSKSARRQNVHLAFEAKSDPRVTHKRILIVDDLVTTGATLDACAQAIKSVCKCRIFALAVARA